MGTVSFKMVLISSASVQGCMVSTKHKYIDVILVTLLPFETRTALYLSKLVIGGAPKGKF